MLIHTVDKPYACILCDKTFTRKMTMQQHMLIHTGDKPYSCTLCDTKFTQSCNDFNVNLCRGHKAEV